MAISTPLKLEIRELPMSLLAASGGELMVLHAEELGRENLLVDWEVLRAMEEGGMLVSLGLFYGASLIGYCFLPACSRSGVSAETQ